MKYEEFKEAFESLYYELNRIAETSVILANAAVYHGVGEIEKDLGGDYAAALEFVANSVKQSAENYFTLFNEISLHGITQEGA